MDLSRLLFKLIGKVMKETLTGAALVSTSLIGATNEPTWNFIKFVFDVKLASYRAPEPNMWVSCSGFS